jgi:hypothetical protein
MLPLILLVTLCGVTLVSASAAGGYHAREDGSLTRLVAWDGAVSSSGQAPTDDAYASSSEPAQTHDDDRLGVQASNLGSCSPTGIAYLKFDAGFSGSLSRAALWMYNTLPSSTATVLGVHAVADDSWVESTLTWNNAPPLGALLASAIPPASAGWMEFSSPGLTAYMVGEQGGDGIASLAVQVDTCSGDLVDVNVFEDRENTGGSGELPYLLLESVTAVELVSLTAKGQDGQVLVEWQTASEMDNLGFNLYRSESSGGMAGGAMAQLNDVPIPSQAQGPPLGAAYSYSDGAVVRGRTYAYWLEDVATDGATSLHGPVQATAGVSVRYLPLLVKG